MTAGIYQTVTVSLQANINSLPTFSWSNTQIAGRSRHYSWEEPGWEPNALIDLWVYEAFLDSTRSRWSTKEIQIGCRLRRQLHRSKCSQHRKHNPSNRRKPFHSQLRLSRDHHSKQSLAKQARYATLTSRTMCSIPIKEGLSITVLKALTQAHNRLPQPLALRLRMSHISL